VNDHLEDTLYRQLAWAAGLPFVDLRAYRISGGILRKVPAALARSRRWVPMVFNCRRVVLVVDNPAAPFGAGREEVAELLGVPPEREIGFALAAPSALDALLAGDRAPAGSG
jgi:hypothetical protein